MRRSSRTLVALLSAALLVGSGSMGTLAATQPAAPQLAATQPGAQAAEAHVATPRVAQPKAVDSTGPVLGKHPAHPSQAARSGSAVAQAKALAAAAKTKPQHAAQPAATYVMSGRVTGASAAPLPDITINVCSYANCLSGALDLQTATTDSSGNWSVSVPDGWYSIAYVDLNWVYAVGFYTESGFTYNPARADRIHVSGAGIGALDVQMPLTYSVSGRVRNTGATNLANIEVRGYVDGIYYNATSSATDGTYDLSMPKGDVSLFLDDAAGNYVDGWWVNPGVSIFSADAVPVPVASPVSGVNVTLTAAKHIKGKVLSPGGSGVGGVSIEAYCNGEVAAWTETNSDGTYSLGLASGSYTLFFLDPTGTYGWGWRGSPNFSLLESQAGLVTVETGDVTGINITLPLSRYIRGTVTDAASANLDNIEVDFYSGGTFYGYTYTGLDGSYFMPVAPGSYQVGFYDETWTYAGGWYSSSGFQYWYASAGFVDVTSASASGRNVQLPLATAPGAPINVTGVGYNQSVLVSWTQPANKGGLDGLVYDVTSTPGHRTCQVSYQTSCLVDHLTNGLSYTFVVTATNRINVSPDSIASGSVTPSAVPDEPTNARAAGFDGSIVASWGQPDADNGSPVTGFTATATAVGGSHTCATLSTDPAPLTCTITGLTNGTFYAVTVTAANVNGTGPAASAGSVAPRVGNSYVPLTPNRILDTHNSTGLPGPLVANTPATFQVTGQSANPAENVPANATAVTGVLSVSNATAKGYLSLTPYPPAGASTTSTINFPVNDARATGVTVTLSATGSLTLTYGATAGTAHAAFDVTGYFVLGSSGATYYALTPNRIVDSRPAYKIGITTGQLTAGAHRNFAVMGLIRPDVTRNVPSGAVAVTGTLTVTGQTAPGYLSLGPDAMDAPPTASLFFPQGDNRATGLTIKLAPGGSLNVTFTSSVAGAKTDVIFDVNGYFLPGESGAMYVPLTPNRLVDTRKGVGIARAIHPYIGTNFQVTGRVPLDVTQNVPASAVAITGTLTVTGQTALGYLSLTKTPINRPTTSTMNFPKGDNRATGVTVPLGPGGKLSVTYGATPASMTTAVVFDVSGYFRN